MYRDERRKPIVQKGETPTLVGNLGYLNKVICPNCGKYLTAYYDADVNRTWYIADDWNYCGRCGQHLDLDEYKRFGKDIVFEDEQMETQTKTQNSNLTFEKDECSKEYEELGLKEMKELRMDRWWDTDGAEHIEKSCHKPESLQYRAYCSEPKEDTECRGCRFWY